MTAFQFPACQSVCLAVFLSAFLRVCVSTCLSVCLSIFLSACLCLSACLSACLSPYLPACLFVCLAVPVCLPACLPICLPACLSVCLSVFLSVCLPSCLPICLCLGFRGWADEELFFLSSASIPDWENCPSSSLDKLFLHNVDCLGRFQTCQPLHSAADCTLWLLPLDLHGPSPSLSRWCSAPAIFYIFSFSIPPIPFI